MIWGLFFDFLIISGAINAEIFIKLLLIRFLFCFFQRCYQLCGGVWQRENRGKLFQNGHWLKSRVRRHRLWLGSQSESGAWEAPGSEGVVHFQKKFKDVLVAPQCLTRPSVFLRRKVVQKAGWTFYFDMFGLVHFTGWSISNCSF